MKLIDISGQQFGRLTVRERAVNNKHGKSRWRCTCSCGNETVVDGNSLRQGNTQSCGCLQKERTTAYKQKHGKSHLRIYSIWTSMRSRCSNQHHKDWQHYGGRGICVCPEWNCNFMSFYHWATVNGYSDNLTIDRIDVNGNYTPDNCRFVTQIQQQTNRRNNTDFPGVSTNRHSNRYHARLIIHGKFVLQKTFKTKIEAIIARIEAEKTFGIVIERK